MTNGDARPPMQRRLLRLALALALFTVAGSGLVGWMAWDGTRREMVEGTLANNLNVAQVLASDIGASWGDRLVPESLEDQRRHWSRTEPLYRGSMQVVGPGGVLLYDSRGGGEVGTDIGDRPLPARPGQPATLGALAASGRDWAGLREAADGGTEAIAFASVPGHEALVAVRVPYDAILDEVRAACLPWALGLAAIALGAGPLTLLVMHGAYRMAAKEAERANESTRRYAARLATLNGVDRAILGARTPVELADASLDGLARVVPLEAAWVYRQDANGVRVLLSARGPGAGVAPAPPVAGEPLVHVPLHVDDERIGELLVRIGYADALSPEHRDVLREVADALTLALRQLALTEAIRTHADELERRVEERTARLTEAVDELGAFAYTVAHDLRAPLRAVAGLAELVEVEEGERLGSAARDHLARIREAGARMDRLVVDLLDYTMLGREETRLAPLDLARAVGAAVALVEEAARARGAHIDTTGPFPAVMGSVPLVELVLRNLLSNALKFVPAERAPEVRVTAETRGGRVRVAVSDNGPGIAPEHRERIFGMFQRLHGPDAPGTGVGLALVRRAVHRMGGTTGVVSDAGRGSMFWFELPAAEGVHVEREPNGAAGRR